MKQQPNRVARNSRIPSYCLPKMTSQHIETSRARLQLTMHTINHSNIEQNIESVSQSTNSHGNFLFFCYIHCATSDIIQRLWMDQLAASDILTRRNSENGKRDYNVQQIQTIRQTSKLFTTNLSSFQLALKRQNTQLILNYSHSNFPKCNPF